MTDVQPEHAAAHDGLARPDVDAHARELLNVPLHADFQDMRVGAEEVVVPVLYVGIDPVARCENACPTDCCVIAKQSRLREPSVIGISNL